MSDSEFQVLPAGTSKQNEIDVGLLVETIQQYEFIYNMGHPEYKNAKKKNLAWEEIAVFLNCSVADCQRTWKSLRDRFTKEKNKVKSGSEAPESNWAYFNLMLFYSNYSKPRKTYTSTKIGEKTPSRPSTSNSVLPIDEVMFSPSSHQSFDDDDIYMSTAPEDTATPSQPKRENTPISKGSSKKRKRPEEEAGILNLVKEISASLETVTAKAAPQASNANRAFGDYVFERLEEMESEEAKMKRRQIFSILES